MKPARPVATALPTAILLAAGMGRRLGCVPKSALEFDGLSLLERLVQALRMAGVHDIGMVIGPYADILQPLARRADVQVIEHRHADPTLIESQRLAVQSQQRHHPGRDLMLLVADLPLLEADDVRPLLDAWAQRPANVQAQVPVVHGTRGHPVLLSWQAVQDLAAQPSSLGVRDWLRRSSHVTRQIASERAAYVTDLDTPEDLAALRLRFPGCRVAWPDRVVGQPGQDGPRRLPAQP